MSKAPLLVYTPVIDSRRPHIERLAELHDHLVLLHGGYGNENGTLPNWSNDLFKAILEVQRHDIDLTVVKIQNYCKEYGCDPVGLISLTETGMYFGSNIAQLLGLRFPSKEILVGVRDKYQMRKLFSEHGLPTVSFSEVFSVEEAYKVAEEIGYPVVIKPRLAGGSLYIRRIDNPITLHDCFDEYLECGINVVSGDPMVGQTARSVIIEKLIEGVTLFDTNLDLPVGEVSVEGFVIEGRVCVLGHHDKPLPSNGPYYEEVLWSTPTRLPFNLISELNDLAERTVKAVKLDNSFFHIEARTTNEGLVLLEIAGRMGGGPIYKSIRESTGIDMMEIMYRLHTHLPITDDLINPIHHRPVMTFGLFADEGDLESIENLDVVRAHPSVIEAVIYENPGTYIHRAPRSYHCTAHVMVTADTHTQAEEIGCWAKSQIAFRTKFGSAGRLRYQKTI